MIFKVVAVSRDLQHSDNISIDSSARNISGFSAGICYADGYDEDSVYIKLNDLYSNVMRHDRVIDTAHHSISDHAVISVYLGNISKMLAMMLNSLEFYTTSERSARYTNVAKNITGKDADLYNKWKDKLKDIISKEYPSLDSKRVEKLSMENARYFLSVFNKTTSMVYTTSYRQWSYIMQWIDKLHDIKNSTYYFKELLSELDELKDNILMSNIGTYSIVDTKGRCFRFLANQVDDYSLYGKEFILDSYQVRYRVSLACLAQSQRHRTLKYFMNFDGISRDFYIPDIIPNDLRDEWISDMKSVADMIPQATLVEVLEAGSIPEFILKCKERLCGRAQLEVAKNTADTLSRLTAGYKGNNPYIEKELASCIKGNRVISKCELIGICKEPCEFGAVHAIDRRV